MIAPDDHVFISYSRHDEDLARALRDRLGEAQIPCFMDTGEIRAGDDFRQMITGALDRSALVAVICTSRSLSSQEVTFEWAYAMALGVPVVPVVYESGLNLHGALAPLDRLNFVDPQYRQWDRLIARVIEARSQRRVTLGLVRSLGIDRLMLGRAQIARGSVGQLLDSVSEASDLLVVGRSLESWSREFQALQDCIDRRDVRVRIALVDPELTEDNWLIPSDYAKLDLQAAIDKFGKIVAPPATSSGSFNLYYLPNSPIFSFVYLHDGLGPLGLLELGANLSFDERFAMELRHGNSGQLIAGIYKVYDAMLSSRNPVISLP